MSLASVSMLVAAHSGELADNERTRAEAENRITRVMFAWMGWGVLIAAIGIAMLVVNKSFDFGQWFGMCSSFLLLGGTGIAVFGFFKAIREGLKLSNKAEARVIGQTQPTKYLPEDRIDVPMPSVTERTTQLIESDKKRAQE